jgi:glycosyltransferase involved in cell wall biosynthesis
MLKISVVIGTLNQAPKLKKVLDAFQTQTLDPSDYEVIVVDSTSTDDTPQLLENYTPNYPFKYKIQENQGKAAARNRGIEMASSPIIFITDADMIADPNLLKAHVEAHTHYPSPACFEGLAYNMQAEEWPPNPHTLSPQVTNKCPDGGKLGWYFFLTGNVSFPKDLITKMGMFDEEFKGYGWEDLELGYRLSRKKVPLYYLKAGINYHYHVINKEEEIARNYHKGTSAKLFLRKHPELKLFLGLNPLSIWAHRKFPKDSALYLKMEKHLSAKKGSLKHRIAVWFLSEHSYLSGILS